MSDDFLDERKRAEDILLGSLGFGEEAQIVSLTVNGTAYKGTGRWSDGESFEFQSEEELDDLQLWALAILKDLK